jgi:hypothetical protein
MSVDGGRGPVRSVVAALSTGLVLAIVLVACSSGSPAARRTSSGPGAGASTGTRSSGSSSTPGGSAGGAGPGQNLPVTSDVRAQLLAAGAALHGLPSSDYTGLVPGTTYYALDVGTGDYWAGAGLVPAPGSYDAGVRNQDEGAYMILTRSAGGAWHGWETGLTGGPPGPCPVVVPSAVLAAWGWPPRTCYPPSSAPSSTSESSGRAQPCASSQITARLSGTPSSQDQYELVLELTNGGTTACTATGFPGFELVGPRSNGSTTYDPPRQAVSSQAVTVPAGGAAHANFYALPGPDSCDAGRAWVPTSVTVTLPDTTTSFSVAWPGGSVDNCQGGATHPGTYVGPVEAGA